MHLHISSPLHFLPIQVMTAQNRELYLPTILIFLFQPLFQITQTALKIQRSTLRTYKYREISAYSHLADSSKQEFFNNPLLTHNELKVYYQLPPFLTCGPYAYLVSDLQNYNSVWFGTKCWEIYGKSFLYFQLDINDVLYPPCGSVKFLYPTLVSIASLRTQNI